MGRFLHPKGEGSGPTFRTPKGEEKCTSRSKPKCPNHHSGAPGPIPAWNTSTQFTPRDENAHQGAADLFYADIIDEEYQQEASGFFCNECLEKYDLIADERITLLSAIRERMADAAAAAAGFR